jgi:hypothetical protein
MTKRLLKTNGVQENFLYGDNSGNLKATLETTLDDTNDSITVYPKASDTNTAASALIKTGAGNIYGIIINSHTSGTLKLWDNTAASGTVICETITLAVGERSIPFFGASFGTGLYVTIGGTANITVIYR